MKSRLLAKLDSEIAARIPGEERASLIAERASYLARLGDVHRARIELSALREQLPRGSSAKVSVMIHIAEGLCHYYTDMGPDAKDRFTRAHALARATGLEDLSARAASWLALIHYGEYCFADMVKCLDESLLRTTVGRDASTLARSNLIVAQTIHLANRFDLALPWYRRARLLSAENEDEATISALMHNMASIWATNARNAVLGGPATTDSSRQALAGAMSTLNFDDLVGLSNLSVFTPLLRAQVSSIEGDYEQALQLYNQHLATLNLKAVKGWQVWLLADKGRCQVELGQFQEARRTLTLASNCVNEGMHIDDLAAVISVLEKAHDTFGAEVPQHSLSLSASDCWARFTELQDSMLAAIEASEGVKRTVRGLPQ